MDRNLLKAIFFSLLIYMIWIKMGFLGKPKQQTLPPKKIVQKISETQSAKLKISEDKKPEKKDLPPIKVKPAFEEKIVTLQTPAAELSFSNRGQGLKSIYFKKYKKTISLENAKLLPLSISRIGENEAIYLKKFTIVPNPDYPDNLNFKYSLNEKLEVSSHISSTDSDYLFRMEIILKNNSNNDYFLKDGLEIIAGNMKLDKGKPYSSLQFSRFTIENKTENISHKKVKGEESLEEQFYWAGIQNTTYCSILKESNLFRKVNWGPSIEKDMIWSSVSTDDLLLQPGEEKILSYDFYFGPKLFFHMRDLGLTFENIINYGSILGPIVKPLVLFLNFLFNLTGNYGIAIIIMTIAFKLATYPLTKKSMVSMKKMQSLQPQMTQVQEQYKNDAMAMQKATMALYKKHGVNPLSGCLPMVIQMPVFIAFYKAISNSVELQGASFFIIKDLAAPDALIPLFTKLPFLGSSINILPILMAAVQFISSKQTTTDPRQKGMMYFFPVFMLMIFYRMPSGLVLYFLISTLVGIIQNHLIKSPSKA